MSNHLISLAYKRRLGSPMRKAVMVLLADKASDGGDGIWASKQTMADELDCSRQSIINTLKSLIADKLIEEVGQRQNANGFTVEYRIKVSALEALPLVKCHMTRQTVGRVKEIDGSTPLTGQSGGRVNDVDATRQRGGHKPSLNPSPPVRAKALPTPAGGSGPAGDDLGEGKKPDKPAAAEPQSAKPRKRAVGSRLSEGWQAPAVADLPLEVQAVVGLWPAGAYELTAIMFRNHWLAEGRAIGAKRDWARTWHNWLLRENMTILRAVKAGQRFDATAPAVATRPAPAESAAAADVLAQKVGETEQVRQIRRLVRLRMGPAPYDSWLKVSAIEIRRGEVRVTSPTTFQASWVEQHFALPLREAAQEVLGEELRVRVGVARPGESKAA